jgi:hypothetical protein
MLELEIAKGGFDEAQKGYLLRITKNICALAGSNANIISKLRQYKNLEREFISLWDKYDGNNNDLTAAFRKFEDDSMPYVKEFSQSIKSLKNKLGVK